ncbi:MULTISPECIES: hypothetical protein [Arthrobacter]|uniref:hypothetical protein n=1 Tax=Arthrobacter TaxID=1663 RepID=UPI001472E17F|nr:hypothetical protein [Arthrobacter psychrochitiniphilus]NYG18927.1 hypothetical protein [Arthrobacter psychrochitiniphilus]
MATALPGFWVLSLIDSGVVNDALMSVQSFQDTPAAHKVLLTGVTALTMSSNDTK